MTDRHHANPEHKATLGCGTLILIALIVLIFGNVGEDDLEQGLRETKIQVEKLEASLRVQTEEIRELRKTIEAQVKELSALRNVEKVETP